MFAGLSLDQAPPFRAPLKFFLMAPVFGVFAGIFAVLYPLSEPHSVGMIANVHIITIGVILLSIFGALQQMLPVVAGATIPKPQLVSNITFYSIVFGLLAFIEGFVLYSRVFFDIAAILLFLGIGFFLSIALNSLRKVQNKSYIVKGMIASLIFLFVAIFIGTHLLISYATGNFSSFHTTFTLLHYNFIFFGGLVLLIASITFQVVPMFWVAKDFEQKDQKIIFFGVGGLLSLLSLTSFFIDLFIVYKIAMSIVLFYFIYITYDRLKTRRRKLTDYTIYFYYSSILFLGLGTIYWLSMDIFRLDIKPLVILWGFGFVLSLINGMVYKIIPFLTWFHLNAQGVFDIPTMRDMIPTKLTKIQFYVHILVVVVLFLGFVLNIEIILKSGAILFIISNAILFYNLLTSSRIFIIKDKVQNA